MRKIVFATGNSDKFREVKEILEKKDIEIIQKDLDYPELQEDELEPIASYGARWTAEKLNMPVIVDDSGIFIHALNGFPGPYSAFVEKHLGNQKILKLMDGETNRDATFKSVIGYCEPGREPLVFTGEVEGKITHDERGTGGFGFDPIFEYHGKTFAEIGDSEKNKVSHRQRALEKFYDWLD